VIFLISRVGTSIPAEQFVNSLDNDPTIRSLVYCSPERIEEARAAVQGHVGGDEEYVARVSGLLFFFGFGWGEKGLTMVVVSS
jgi:hypothetical protein